jgi:hypothetical protein
VSVRKVEKYSSGGACPDGSPLVRLTYSTFMFFRGFSAMNGRLRRPNVLCRRGGNPLNCRREKQSTRMSRPAAGVQYPRYVTVAYIFKA